MPHEPYSPAADSSTAAQRLPSISIIMPSFNCAAFIRESLDSILSSKYPGLEVWVMDGGSTDGTVEILKSFGPAVRWISQKDKGQSDALNQGFRRATGKIIGWLNADDLYEPDALGTVGRYFSQHPETLWLIGRCSIIDGQGHEIRRWISGYKSMRLARYSYRALLTENFIAQMGVFMRRGALDQAGPLDESLHYAMDYDLWLRLGKLSDPAVLPVPLAKFRMYETSKSITGFTRQFDEDYAVACRHGRGQRWPLFWHAVNRAKITAVYSIMAWFRRITAGR